MGHFFLAEATDDGAGQNAFDENIFIQNHVFAAVGAEALKDAAGVFWKISPLHGFDHGLHVGDALGLIPVLVGPIEAQGRTPVMNNEDHIVGDTDLFPQGVQVFPLFGIGVAVRP